MKIQYASDLHLEFGNNQLFWKLYPLQVVGDILILAGDIGYFNHETYTDHPLWDWASENYRETIVVIGNHELYKNSDLALLKDGSILIIRKNVKAYYNTVIRIEDNDIIVSTLWAHVPPENAFVTECGVADFHHIMYGNERFTVKQFNAEHERCVNFIKKAVAESTAEHIVLATHHVPSFALESEDFKGSRLNGAFVSELSDFITASRIDYWIYGHSHRNIEKMIGNTKCVCNQLGYVYKNEHDTFRNDTCFNLW